MEFSEVKVWLNTFFFFNNCHSNKTSFSLIISLKLQGLSKIMIITWFIFSDFIITFSFFLVLVLYTCYTVHVHACEYASFLKSVWKREFFPLWSPQVSPPPFCSKDERENEVWDLTICCWKEGEKKKLTWLSESGHKRWWVQKPRTTERLFILYDTFQPKVSNSTISYMIYMYIYICSSFCCETGTCSSQRRFICISWLIIDK